MMLPRRWHSMETAFAFKKNKNKNHNTYNYMKEYLYKILVVGDLGSGKTSIIKRYVHNVFSLHYKSTIGVDFALKVIPWNSECLVRLQLWDIAGQERFGSMTRVYYKEAIGAIVVFDLSRPATYEAASKWKRDIDDKVCLPDGTKIPVILLANKRDLAGVESLPVPIEDYCKENDFIGWFETSAKDNLNIEEACRFLVQNILDRELNPLTGNSVNVKNPLSSLQSEKSSCC